MNRAALKNYAPQARVDFISVVSQRAQRLGITPTHIAVTQLQGDVLFIDGLPFPARIAPQRQRLIERIHSHGYTQTMEEMAYIWFNRFVAIRFMEIHGYLEHGFRVLSHPDNGNLPEILQQASYVDLQGLNKQQVQDYQLAGNKDAELYRLLLIAQCNALHHAMPFLFEKIDDETELLLPDNLLHSDSVIRQLVAKIDESDWQDIEIIGWLYQFYIADKKDQVIGKVVSSENIPAATQLFTPNWIVKYMVQNSLGAQWLATYPQSPLKAQMAYYIEPAEQSAAVNAQLKALTPSELKPEELTLLDPACGSGHILVEAYEVFKEIYIEAGYRLREIPRLILANNIFGLDIDDRAAQLASFALLMKARADDRRLFDDPSNPPVLNVYAIQESHELDLPTMCEAVMQAAIALEGGEVLGNRDLFGGSQMVTLHSSGLTARDLLALAALFEQGKTFGSLLQVPLEMQAQLPLWEGVLQVVIARGDVLAQSYARQLLAGFVRPAGVLMVWISVIIFM